MGADSHGFQSLPALINTSGSSLNATPAERLEFFILFVLVFERIFLNQSLKEQMLYGRTIDLHSHVKLPVKAITYKYWTLLWWCKAEILESSRFVKEKEKQSDI